MTLKSKKAGILSMCLVTQNSFYNFDGNGSYLARPMGRDDNKDFGFPNLTLESKVKLKKYLIPPPTPQ